MGGRHRSAFNWNHRGFLTIASSRRNFMHVFHCVKGIV